LLAPVGYVPNAALLVAERGCGIALRTGRGMMSPTAIDEAKLESLMRRAVGPMGAIISEPLMVRSAGAWALGGSLGVDDEC
jgi:hypothetical protein